METKDIKKKLEDYSSDLIDLKNKLDIDSKDSRLTELDQITSNPDFWSSSNTKEVLEEQKQIRNIINKYNDVYDSVSLMLEMCELELGDDDVNNMINDIDAIEPKLNELKLTTFLNGEFDSSNAYIEIHPYMTLILTPCSAPYSILDFTPHFTPHFNSAPYPKLCPIFFVTPSFSTYL